MAEFVRFPTTLWSTLLSRPGEARSDVFVRYRTPIFNYIRNQGFQESDADDLTQEVFVRVCRDEFLSRADREKGRFRSLLLGVARNIILQEREKRSNRKRVPARPEAAPEADAEFDKLWLKHLVDRALERLQGETAAGGPRHYDAFVMHKVQGLSYTEISAKLGVALTDTRNWIHAAKTKLKKYLAEEVESYCSSKAECDEELASILAALR